MQTKDHNYFPELKLATDDFEIEIGYELFNNQEQDIESNLIDIENNIHDVDRKINSNNDRLDALNSEIEKLKNHADGIDYLVASASGALSAMLDTFLIGDLDLLEEREWGSDKVNKFVMKIAKMHGYKGNNLEKAIKSLEKKFKLPSDSNTNQFGGGLQHHLRDFAHHPTIVGLLFSLLTQFTRKSYGTDTDGKFIIIDVIDHSYIGEDLPKKILFGVVFWFFHMVSDMAGSSNNPGKGTGLPGPLLSFIKELSVLPLFKNIHSDNNDLSVWISKLFNGTLLGERDENGKLISPLRFDLRTEIGIVHHMGRQSIPIIINECIVRGFYFIRRLQEELKSKNISGYKDLTKIELKKVLPFNNRTLTRMLTVSTAVFTAIDLGDAAARSAIKSNGSQIIFVKEFILKINLVGLGRFALAISMDSKMEIKDIKLRDERIKVLTEQLHYMEIKAYYSQAAMWVQAVNTERTINEVLDKMEETTDILMTIQIDNQVSMKNIEVYKKNINEKNPELLNLMLETLRWGV